MKSKKTDIILSTAPPFSTHLLAYALHKVSCKPLILDFRDLWTGNSFYTKGLSNFRIIIEAMIEKLVVSHASLVLVTTEGARDYFIRKYPRVGVEKIVLLPNGFDPEIFYPSANNNVRFQNHEKITFVYSGSLTKRRTPEFFFRAFKTTYC